MQRFVLAVNQLARKRPSRLAVQLNEHAVEPHCVRRERGDHRREPQPEINNNDCGVGDQSGFDQNNDGATSFFPNISLDGETCQSRDEINVVGWRYLNDAGDGVDGAVATLAVACVWHSGFSAYEVWESDVVFDSDDPWFVTGPANCGYVFDIEGVMTHERGHTVGMMHADEDAHHWLTMSPIIDACDVSTRTLAIGEANFMNSGY